MTVGDFDADDLFVVRVVKSLTTNPSNKWVNSYEIKALESGTVGVLLTFGEILVDYEQALHSELVAFDRLTISTWEPDSVPYDPTAFVSVPLTDLGLRSSVPNEVEPLGMAWRVNRQASSGRFGNIFYRGAMYENEVNAPAGIPVLSDPVDMAQILADAITDSTLDSYLGAIASGSFNLVMINFTGTQIRPILNLVSGGVSLIKQDHQWFNRTSSPS